MRLPVRPSARSPLGWRPTGRRGRDQYGTLIVRKDLLARSTAIATSHRRTRPSLITMPTSVSLCRPRHPRWALAAVALCGATACETPADRAPDFRDDDSEILAIDGWRWGLVEVPGSPLSAPEEVVVLPLFLVPSDQQQNAQWPSRRLWNRVRGGVRGWAGTGLRGASNRGQYTRSPRRLRTPYGSPMAGGDANTHGQRAVGVTGLHQRARLTVLRRCRARVRARPLPRRRDLTRPGPPRSAVLFHAGLYSRDNRFIFPSTKMACWGRIHG